MPIKDPEKAAENNRKRQKTYKEKKKAERLRGEDAPTPAAVLTLVRNEPEDAGPDAPKRAAAGPMSTADWARAKVALGNKLCNLSSKAIDAAILGKAHPLGPRDAGSLLRLGIELINANLGMLQPTEGPKRGNLEQEHPEDLRDPEYRRIMLAGLRRRQELKQLKQQRTG